MPGPDDPPMGNIEVDLYLHVRVLIAIIIALSVTRLLGGVAQFMRQSDNHRVSWIHLAWVAWVFFNVIAFWWWEFRLSQVTHWTFALYLFVIAYEEPWLRRQFGESYADYARQVGRWLPRVPATPL